MSAAGSRQVYLRRINRVIDHVEAHLDEPLPLEALARLAHFSPFHFHRVFRSLAGETLRGFVGRLRLERAIRRMEHGPKSTLTEVALACGFGSSSDFSRAFKQAYGFPPRHYTRERLRGESKIRQDLRANAGYNLGGLPRPGNPDRFRVRLAEVPGRRVAYVRVIGGYEAGPILAGFDRLMAWGLPRGLVPGAELIGLSRDDPEVTPLKKYRFDWCLTLPPGVEADGDASPGTIPAGRFALLRCRGDIGKVDRAWTHLFRRWLPESGLQPADAPALEVFRAHPLVAGWDGFDLDCCLPVRPLGRR